MKNLCCHHLKHLIILTFIASVINLESQTISTGYQTQINSTFAGVDLTKVPHKLLVDYAMEFTELSAYNGILTNNNLTHRGHYTDIYNTLLMSRVQTNVPGLVNPNTFRANWDNLRQPNKIVLSGCIINTTNLKTMLHQISLPFPITNYMINM